MFHQIIELPLDPALANGSCVGHARADWWTSDDEQEQGAAKHLCRSCPVRAPCLDRAIAGSEHGIWGALDDRQRVLLGAIPRRGMG